MDFLDLTKYKDCSCGANVESVETISVKHKYSWIGWFFWTMGTTAIPTEILFTCNSCNKEFEKITKKPLIKHYIFYKRT